MKRDGPIEFNASATGRGGNDRVSSRNESNIFKYPEDTEFVLKEI